MTVRFDTFVVPLGYQGIQEVLPDGLDVVGAEVDEASLLVRLHYVADDHAPVMKRKVQAAPPGARMDGARHVWTLMRLGVAYHYCIEE